jgi:glycosyltransferase involved in cell wall biosynthesis
MLCSYSVIVPVLNKQDGIVRTLRSIADSMVYFDGNHPRADGINGEVVVVDDGSTDRTPELVREFARSDPRVRIVQHHRSLGIGAARNTGVRVSGGQVLFYCDGDDLYLREHLFVGFSMLDHSASVSDAGAGRSLLRIGDRGHIILSASEPLAAVRTGVYVRDAIHPFWKRRLLNTIAQNLCVRRECHEWGEGFPEEAVYKRIGGCEDVAYNGWLNTFFRVGVIQVETVEYIRYPGNSFDRQLDTFRRAPDPARPPATPEQLALHDIRFRREEEKIDYLLDKWRVLGPPPLSSALVNWESIVREFLRRGMRAFAVETADQAARLGRELPVELVEEITSAVERVSPAEMREP